jgi:GNAT superfamily N-acetyltransferase
MKIIKITSKLKERYQSELAALEKSASYPLGQDSFQLDHGRDYFAFFERLGALHYYAAVEDGAVIGVGAGIIRRVPQKTWYLCDLKIHPDYRGRNIPLKILGRAFLPGYLRCRRGYAISMNPANGRPNRIAKMFSRFKRAPFSIADELMIFSLESIEIRGLRKTVEKHRGPLRFLSLKGKKDLIMKSTAQPMSLLHAQFGPCGASEAETIAEPLDGHVHMLCAPKKDALFLELSALGLRASSSATIIEHGMGGWNWNFILTSDI